MKFLGFLAAATLTGLCLAPAGAASDYLLTIENPSATSYTVAVHDLTKTHTAALAPGKSMSFNLATQTPKVAVTSSSCSTSVTPSIKTYVTLKLLANCKVETKAAGVSGF